MTPQTGRPICERCGAEILWGVTEKGRRMPIDLEPNPYGNLAVYRDHTQRLRVRVLGKGEKLEPYEKPGMAHFATCPGKAVIPLHPEVPSLAAARDARRRRDFAKRRGLV